MIDLAQLRKLMLLALSTDSGNEAAVAISMVKAALAKQGQDLHWLAGRIESGGNGSSAPESAVDAAYQAGLAKGRREVANGYSHGWAPDQAHDATMWTGPDLQRGMKAPPQRWAAWLLTRRGSQLTDGSGVLLTRWRAGRARRRNVKRASWS